VRYINKDFFAFKSHLFFEPFDLRLRVNSVEKQWLYPSSEVEK